MHTSTLVVTCTARISTTTVRTSFIRGEANTALAVTTASVNKTANATSTPHQQCSWTPAPMLHPPPHHRLQHTSATFYRSFVAFYNHLQHTSAIFQSQLHRVLHLLLLLLLLTLVLLVPLLLLVLLVLLVLLLLLLLLLLLVLLLQ